MNVKQSSMKITDEFYSNLNDGEIQSRISYLGKEKAPSNDDALVLIREFLEWKSRKKQSI